MFELINQDGETLGFFDELDEVVAQAAELEDVGIWTDIIGEFENWM